MNALVLAFNLWCGTETACLPLTFEHLGESLNDAQARRTLVKVYHPALGDEDAARVRRVFRELRRLEALERKREARQKKFLDELRRD